MIERKSSQVWYWYSSSVCESTHLSTSVRGKGASDAEVSPMLEVLCRVSEANRRMTGLWGIAEDCVGLKLSRGGLSQGDATLVRDGDCPAKIGVTQWEIPRDQ